MKTLENQNALVVGGATGIGEAVAFSLAQAECSVAIAGRRVEKLESASRSYDGQGKILFHQVDVADRQSIHDLMSWFEGSVGNVDILVNAAGINFKDRTMVAMKAELASAARCAGVVDGDTVDVMQPGND